jgi:mitogen-activated protein kinase 1/3
MNSIKAKISQKWKQVSVDYKLLEILGTGAFGTVCKAMNRKTNELVAIKLISGVNMSTYITRKVLREVQIMSRLSSKSSNIFTSKLIDIMLPEGDLTHIFLVMTLGLQDLH